MIVGIVVGVTGFICLVVVGVVCYKRRPIKLHGVE
jgi:hypothetical protein